MIIRTRGIQRWFALVAILAGCSQDRSSGGGGFEGETVALSGTVVFGGRPLAHAAVTFVDMKTGATLADASTDPVGRFVLVVSDSAYGFVEARSGDSALARILVEDPSSSAPIALDASGSTAWRARALLEGNPIGNATIRPVGSTRAARTRSDGTFVLVRTGSDVEWAVVTLPDASVREIRLPPVTDSVIEIPNHRQILFDDFEGAGSRTALGWVAGSGWWFALTDASQGGATTIDPPAAETDIRAAYSTADAWKGTSLSIRFSVDQSKPVYYGMVGTVVASEGRWLDLSALDSITFMAKGAGTMRLEIATRDNLEPVPDSLGHFGATVTLPSEWMKVVIHSWDIYAAVGSRPWTAGIPWTIASKQVRNIAFSVRSSTSVQIDDIVLHGPTLAELRGR